MADLRLPAAVAVAALTLAACGTAASPSSDPTATVPTAPATFEDTAPRLPEVTATWFDGSVTSLADLVGTPTVVNFWASWCPPCIAEMPDLEAVHQQADGQVRFVGINTQDTDDRAADLVDQTGVTYELVRDPDGGLFRAFGSFGMPSTFYVDARGVIVGRHTGLLTRDALIADLQEHLGVEVAAAG
jgi:cytochrome c biogenesis protein CcmG, thiol:disulfide interchange protein DsbE